MEGWLRSEWRKTLKEFESNGGAWRQLSLCVRQSRQLVSTGFGCSRVGHGNLPTQSPFEQMLQIEGWLRSKWGRSLNPTAVLGDNFRFAYGRASSTVVGRGNFPAQSHHFSRYCRWGGGFVPNRERD